MTIRTALIPFFLLALSVAPAAAQSVWDGVYTDEQADRGKEIYLAECVLCHGETLLGAEDGPGLLGDYFIEGWDGQTADVLVELIRVTMPIDGPGFLSRAQSTDLTAYIFQENSFPTGDAELKPSIATLKSITISAEK
jgi:mono/diheme cytochrome c family protein